MANNILTSLVLSAKDNASSIIQKIGGSIEGLGKSATTSSTAIGHTGDTLKGLTGAFSGAILQTSLLTSGFGLIASAAQTGLNTIEGQFSKAQQLQQTVTHGYSFGQWDSEAGSLLVRSPTLLQVRKMLVMCYMRY